MLNNNFRSAHKLRHLHYPGTMLVGGKIRQSGTYVSRLFTMGVDKTVDALAAALLPAGSDVSFEVDGGDDVRQAMTLVDTEVLGEGWVEPKFEREHYSAAEGRVFITLAGGPQARPALAGLRAFSY